MRTCKSTEVANGERDLHLTMFDGRRFDFQGVPNRQYVVFSKSGGGDRLITRSRGGTRRNRDGVKAMYFDAFGLNTSSAGGEGKNKMHMIQIETVKKYLNRSVHGDEEQWTVRLQVNGHGVDKEGAMLLAGANANKIKSVLQQLSSLKNVAVK